MSDKHSSHNTADTQEITPQGNLDELNTPPADDAHQTQLDLAQPDTPAIPPENSPQAEEDTYWDEVPLPGTLNLEAADLEAADIPSESVSAEQLAHTVTTERETELLTLIHDLNECNDVLLSRIAQLENDLEKTHATFKTEIDKASFAQEKMAKQVSAEQSSAQQVSQNAQQQVGKLVSQLETNEQLLNRQQLINENLQTELTNSQERITQLERECALASQQYADEAKARVKAETTSRDLRSRLQRQQRYTLQFKAALEKSLTVSTRSTNHTASTAQPVSFNNPATNNPATTPAVTMPKAQRIMPWAAAATSPFQGIDPHLETLIRNAGKPTTTEDSKSSSLVAEPTESHTKASTSVSTPISTAKSTDSAPTGTADSEAEAKLWQDLERVINTATKTTTTKIENPNQPAAETGSQTAEAQTVTAETAVSEEASKTAVAATPDPVTETATPEKPRFNWQNATKAIPTKAIPTEIENTPSEAIAPTRDPQTETESAAKETAKETAKEERVQQENVQISQRTATPIPPVAQPQQTPFTEPSPWGKPLPETVPAKQSAEKTAEKVAANTPPSPGYLPAIDGTSGTAISPVVNPLRTQKKKVGSLAAVELPTFETAKAGSFKR